MGRKKWEPDPIAQAIISQLEDDVEVYRALISEMEIEIRFLRQFASKDALKKAEDAFAEALDKLADSSIRITWD